MAKITISGPQRLALANLYSGNWITYQQASDGLRVATAGATLNALYLKGLAQWEPEIVPTTKPDGTRSYFITKRWKITDLGHHVFTKDRQRQEADQ